MELKRKLIPSSGPNRTWLTWKERIPATVVFNTPHGAFGAPGLTLELGQAICDAMNARAVVGIVKRHTHQEGHALQLGVHHDNHCDLCVALVDGGVLTPEQVGTDTRAWMAAR